MKVLPIVSQFPQATTGTVVTIGNFDGVHLGHRHLISAVRRRAEQLKVPSVVFTFEPHPVQVLFPERQLRRLFPREDQEELLSQLGMDFLVIQPFSRELSQTPPTEFLRKYILEPLKPKALVVGYDFSFGANRTGGVQMLEEFSKANGLSLEVIPAVQMEGEAVSSTRIRKAIAAGDVELAHRLLGRPFYLQGLVQKGDRRGTKIGFPTANLTSIPECIPKKSVYATRATVDGRSYFSVTNVGTNPTFVNSEQIHVETHILGFTNDIYGRPMRVEFLSRLRDEKKFGGIEELIQQIKLDIKSAEKVFNEMG